LGLNILLPDLSPKAHKKLAKAYFAYMAELMLDMMFNIPYLQTHDHLKYLHATNQHFLDDALAQGKGVLMPTLHIGQFFHVLAYCAFMANPDGSAKYEYVVVGTKENISMFSIMIQKQGIKFPKRNVFGIVTRNYADMKEVIARHLKKNRIVMLFYDFTKITHLQTPFDGADTGFMKPTPQSLIALHQDTGAPIVPAIALPQGYLGKSEIIFFDSAPLSLISKQYEHASDKEYHGRICLELNRIMHPYIRLYPHVWEELMAFGIWWRLKKVRFDKNITIENFVTLIFMKVQDLITLSYDPKRDDIQVNQSFESLKQKVMNVLNNPCKVLYPHKTKYRYGANSISQEILGIFRLLHNELIRNGEVAAATEIMTGLMSLKKIL
jgi:lauroyl/myristoyl acyltransferase